jgi:hypothetical protein
VRARSCGTVLDNPNQLLGTEGPAIFEASRDTASAGLAQLEGCYPIRSEDEWACLAWKPDTRFPRLSVVSLVSGKATWWSSRRRCRRWAGDG